MFHARANGSLSRPDDDAERDATAARLCQHPLTPPLAAALVWPCTACARERDASDGEVGSAEGRGGGGCRRRLQDGAVRATSQIVAAQDCCDPLTDWQITAGQVAVPCALLQDMSDAEDDEDWAPAIMKRWESLEKEPIMTGKHYTAFVRFAIKHYDIPASVRVVWRKDKRGSNKHPSLFVAYYGGARTRVEMSRKLRETRNIMLAFPPPPTVDWPYCRIRFYPDKIWECSKWNGSRFFHDVMCVGKGTVPYLPPDIRAHINCF